MLTQEQTNQLAQASLMRMRKLMNRQRPPSAPVRHYSSPIFLTPGRSGRLEVKVAEVTGEMPVVSMRNAMLTGRKPTRLMIDTHHPLRVHSLVEDKVGMWMSDSPEELQQIEDFLYQAGDVNGKHVLVGGLGLGIVAMRLVQRGAHVTVVERSNNVIQLCAKPQHYRTIHMGIRKYLNTSPLAYDAIYLDTWRGTNEDTWWSEVLPLRRLIGQRTWVPPQPQVYSWAEDIMLGQVRLAIPNAFDWAVANGQPRTWHYAKLPDDVDVDEFVGPTVGHPAWEAKYGPGLGPVTFPRGA